MLLSLPPRFDAAGVEGLLHAARRRGPVAGIDCSAVRFIDPCGTLALLAVGLAASWRGGRAWGLVLPRDPGPRGWLERCGARAILERAFLVEGPPEDLDGRDSAQPTLLEVAVVRTPDEVRRAVGRLKARADLLLVTRLGYSPLTADRLSVALAELLQNAVDHSGSPGLAAAQWYPHGPAGVPELRIAVADAGVGVRESLAGRYAHGADRWDDATAVRTVFLEGVSRFADQGRGLGLKAVAAMVRGWGGSLRLRSGTAAGGVVPGGPGNAPCNGLAHFPGTQVDVIVPHADPSAL